MLYQRRHFLISHVPPFDPDHVAGARPLWIPNQSYLGSLAYPRRHSNSETATLVTRRRETGEIEVISAHDFLQGILVGRMRSPDNGPLISGMLFERMRGRYDTKFFGRKCGRGGLFETG